MNSIIRSGETPHFHSLQPIPIGPYMVKMSVSFPPELNTVVVMISYWKGQVDPDYWIAESQNNIKIAFFRDIELTQAFLNCLGQDEEHTWWLKH